MQILSDCNMISSLTNWQTVTACRNPSQPCQSTDISTSLHKARVNFSSVSLRRLLEAGCCYLSHIVSSCLQFTLFLLHNIRMKFFYASCDTCMASWGRSSQSIRDSHPFGDLLEISVLGNPHIFVTQTSAYPTYHTLVGRVYLSSIQAEKKLWRAMFKITSSAQSAWLTQNTIHLAILVLSGIKSLNMSSSLSRCL